MYYFVTQHWSIRQSKKYALLEDWFLHKEHKKFPPKIASVKGVAFWSRCWCCSPPATRGRVRLLIHTPRRALNRCPQTLSGCARGLSLSLFCSCKINMWESARRTWCTLARTNEEEQRVKNYIRENAAQQHGGKREAFVEKLPATGALAI